MKKVRDMTVNCPHCHTAQQIPEVYENTEVKCLRCKQPFNALKRHYDPNPAPTPKTRLGKTTDIGSWMDYAGGVAIAFGIIIGFFTVFMSVSLGGDPRISSLIIAISGVALGLILFALGSIAILLNHIHQDFTCLLTWLLKEK